MPLGLMSLRVFAALPAPEPIVDAAADLMDQVPGAKWRPLENLHVTLAFYGELDEPVIEELDHELAAISCPPFAWRLKGVGRFGKAEPHALWAGVEAGPELTDLARRCRKAGGRAGVEMERRAFIPHLTLAYLERGVDPVRVQRFEQRWSMLETEPVMADRFHLYASHNRKPGQPNLYEAVADYPLAGR
ncbi:MAG: RNA 2',3'-cyclic phosphodiesterase [Oceanicaulis sp.]